MVRSLQPCGNSVLKFADLKLAKDDNVDSPQHIMQISTLLTFPHIYIIMQNSV